MTFKASITLPDAGHLERDYEKLDEVRIWLMSCLRMDGDPATLKVLANGVDITPAIGRELTRLLLREQGSRQR